MRRYSISSVNRALTTGLSASVSACGRLALHQSRFPVFRAVMRAEWEYIAWPHISRRGEVSPLPWGSVPRACLPAILRSIFTRPRRVDVQPPQTRFLGEV